MKAARVGLALHQGSITGTSFWGDTHGLRRLAIDETPMILSQEISIASEHQFIACFIACFIGVRI
jgi:hypothetical protein